MGTTQKRIEILVNFLTKGMANTVAQISRQDKAIKKLTQRLAGPKSISEAVKRSGFSNFNADLASLGNVSDRAKVNMQNLSTVGWGMRKVFSANLSTIKQVNEQGLQRNFTKAGRLAFQIRRLTHGMRGFRMEMLGVLFFGQSIQRLFLGLLTPSLQMVGVFDIWNTILATTFLPTALQVLDKVMIPMMNFFLNLPEPAKETIGAFALFGLGAGTVIGKVGEMALGIGSLILLFQGMPVDISGAKNGIVKFGGAVGLANTKLGRLLGWIGKLVGVGILIKVALDLFGREGVPTKAQFIMDVFGATLGGLLVGGPAGALGGFVIAMIVDLDKVASAKFLNDFNGLLDQTASDAAEHFFSARGDETFVPPEARNNGITIPGLNQSESTLPALPGFNPIDLNNLTININAPDTVAEVDRSQ